MTFMKDEGRMDYDKTNENVNGVRRCVRQGESASLGCEVTVLRLEWG